MIHRLSAISVAASRAIPAEPPMRRCACSTAASQRPGDHGHRHHFARCRNLVGGGIGWRRQRQSSSNRALRASAARLPAVAWARWRPVAAFEYTVLVDGTTTVRVVSDQAGKRVGDCVAVEQGQFANIRLVATALRAARPADAARRPPRRPRRAAGERLRAGQAAGPGGEDGRRIRHRERRMRLLCGE